MDNPTSQRSPEEYYATIEVSFAEKSDLEKLANIHAGTSMADPLLRWTLWNPRVPKQHFDLGRFHYSQAFAAETDAVVLKVTDQKTGEIAGCAWLQLHTSPAQSSLTPPLPLGFSLPDCCNRVVYDWVHEQFHRQRRYVFRQTETHIGEVPHYSIRALDTLDTLSQDDRDQVHKKLVSFLTDFDPKHGIFAQVSRWQSWKLINFLYHGWESEGDIILDPNHAPEFMRVKMEHLSGQEKTLRGLLRPGNPGAAALSPNNSHPDVLSPTIETWRPGLTSHWQPQSIGHQAGSSSPGYSARCPTTTTVNLYLKPGELVPESFEYLSYRDVSIEVTVGYLIDQFRLVNEQMKGVIMIREDGMGGWRTGFTVLVNTPIVQKTLAAVGWGPEINPVWLVVRW